MLFFLKLEYLKSQVGKVLEDFNIVSMIKTEVFPVFGKNKI